MTDSTTLDILITIATTLGLRELIMFLVKHFAQKSERSEQIEQEEKERQAQDAKAQVDELKQQLQDQKTSYSKRLEKQAISHAEEIAKWESVARQLEESAKRSQAQLEEARIMHTRALTTLNLAIAFFEKEHPEETILINALKKGIESDLNQKNP